MGSGQAQSGWTLGQVHHLGLTVGDIERSIRFYRDALGMSLVGRRPKVAADYVAQQTGYEDVELSVASFKVTPDSPQSLELVEYLTHTGQASETASNQPGISHLCLLVDDFDACYASLTAQGVRFKSPPVTITAGPNKGGLVAYLFDPDGYMLELFQPPASK